MKRIMKTPDYPCDLHSKIIDCIYHGPGHPRYTLNFIKLPLFCRHIVLQKSASYLNFSKARASVDWCWCGNTPFAWVAHGLDVVFWFSSGIHEMDGSYIKILHIDYKNPTHKMWCTCTSNISTNQKEMSLSHSEKQKPSQNYVNICVLQNNTCCLLAGVFSKSNNLDKSFSSLSL